jgi:hypothetical protein
MADKGDSSEHVADDVCSTTSKIHGSSVNALLPFCLNLLITPVHQRDLKLFSLNPGRAPQGVGLCAISFVPQKAPQKDAATIPHAGVEQKEHLLYDLHLSLPPNKKIFFVGW